MLVFVTLNNILGPYFFAISIAVVSTLLLLPCGTVKNKLVNQFVSPKTYYNYLKNEVIVVKPYLLDHVPQC